MFDPVDPKQSFPDLERAILQYWREEDTFRRSLEIREGRERFSFYDGPPFATGLPHYGHLLAGTIKDVIPRYQTMRGKYVQRRFGWDCHGLPVENLIEQEHGLKSKKDIEEMGVDRFNELCRTSVMRYVKEWRSTVERTGRWVDMDWDYRTMDPDYMESIWWVFKRLHEKELLYEGRKAMHVCPRCVTPLSNFEVTQGYKDIDDTASTWKFKLTGTKNTFVLAWTTTPWSTLSTMGLSIKPDAIYVKIKTGNEEVIMVKERVEDVMKSAGEYEIVDEFPGSDLVGKEYEHIAPWYADVPEVKKNPRVYHIFAGDYVEQSEGTGIVTINGSYGEIDMEAAKKNGLPIVMDVEMNGHFNDLAGPYKGMYVKDAVKVILDDAQKNGLLWKRESYRHSYPHCWRCETPLLNYATSSWFVRVEQIKENMLAANAETAWVPSHIRDGRFGNWLEGARDWAISRNRYWGTPLPVWRVDGGKELDVIGGRDDLMARFGIRFTKVTTVRHGEGEHNVGHYYQAKAPGAALTKRGVAQAEGAGRHLSSQNVSVIYCSPLRRTRETAQRIADETGASVIVDERLREVGCGNYEGKSIDTGDLSRVKLRRQKKLEANTPESVYHLEGMESWKDVFTRLSSFLDEVLPRHRSEHIVIVSHADPIMSIRHYFTKEDPFKLSHRPYPVYATPESFFWDHDQTAQVDLHKNFMDSISWPGGDKKKSVEAVFVRHGETDLNKDRKIQGGEVDEPLNDTGRAQAQDLAAKLKKGKKKFDCIVSSDLKRAAETADILAKELKIPHTRSFASLRERDMGQWGGQPVDAIIQAHPHRTEATNMTFHFATPEKGESLSQFLRRLDGSYEDLLREFAGKRILIVAHQGVIQGMRTIAENLSYVEALQATTGNGDSADVLISPRFHRIPEVLDCWFESGSMPYAQQHFPFELGHMTLASAAPDVPDEGRGAAGSSSSDAHLPHVTEGIPPGFPADFIAEGIDQTRGWFYTLMVLSTALFHKPAFMNCVVNGIVLAEDGRKMSKRLKNYPEPTELVEKHGADALRFALMSSPAVRGEDLRFSEHIVEETVRSVLLPLWNSYSFFVTYANLAKFEPVAKPKASGHPLDLWIKAEMQDLVNRMTGELDRYELASTCGELHETIDALTNWYIRLSRRRFAGKGQTSDAVAESEPEQFEDERTDALNTLYDVLITLSQLLAPFCPFVTDAIYLNLVPEEHGSIHLTDWPEPRALTNEEQKLLRKNRLLRLIVSLGLKVRAEKTVKLRQPLARAIVAFPASLLIGDSITNDDIALLRQELNVKEVTFADDPGSLGCAIVQVDARKVGPRLGKRVQDIIRAGKEGEFELAKDGSILILDETLGPDEATIVYRGNDGQNIAAERGAVVSIDTAVTKELQAEGLARDIVRAVQRLRKEAGLSVSDRIRLSIKGADDVLSAFGTFITQETNALLEENGGTEHVIDLEDVHIRIRLETY